MASESGGGSSSSSTDTQSTSTTEQQSESSGGGEGQSSSQDQAALIDQREAEQEAQEAEQAQPQAEEQQAAEAQGEGGEQGAGEPDQEGAPPKESAGEKEEGEGSEADEQESEASNGDADDDTSDAQTSSEDDADSMSDDDSSAAADESESRRAIDEAEAQAEAQQRAADMQAPKGPEKPDAYTDMLQRMPRMDMQSWAQETQKSVFEALDKLVSEYGEGGEPQDQDRLTPEQAKAQAAEERAKTPDQAALSGEKPTEAPKEVAQPLGEKAEAPSEQGEVAGRDARKDERRQATGTREAVLKFIDDSAAQSASRGFSGEAAQHEREQGASTGRGQAEGSGGRKFQESLPRGQGKSEAVQAPGDKPQPQQGPRDRAPRGPSGPPDVARPAVSDVPPSNAADKPGPRLVEPRDAESVMRGPTELSRALNDIGKENVRYFKDSVNKGVLPVVTAIDQKLLVRDEQGRVMGDVRKYWKGTSGTEVPATNLKPGTYVADTRTGEVRQFKDGKLQPELVGKLRPMEARSSREALASGHVDLFVSARDPARREAFLKAISATPEKLQKKEGWQPYRALVMRVPERRDMMSQYKQEDAKWSAVKRESLGRVNDHIEDSLKGIVRNPEQIVAGVVAGKAGLYAAGSDVAMRFGEAKAIAQAAQTRDEILVSREMCAGGIAHAAILATGEAVGASARAAIGARFRTDPNTLLRRSAEALGAERAAAGASSRAGGSLPRAGGASMPEGPSRGGGAGAGGEGAGGGGGRPPRDTVPDYYSETLPGRGTPGEQGAGGAGRDTVPDYRSDTLPGRGTPGKRGTGGAGRRGDTLPGLGPDAPERGATGRGDTLPGLGPEAAERGAAGRRGDTLPGLGPESPPPAASLREHWSRAARESEGAPQAERGAAARQEAAPRDAPGAADRAAAGAPDGTSTMPAFSDRQIRFLGADAADQAGRLGMRPAELDNYVGDLYRRELLLGRDANAARANAAQTARDQIAGVHSLSQDLGRELTQYGYSPDDIAQSLKEFGAKGLTREQVLESFGREVQYMNHLRDEFCGGSMELARAKLAGVGDARQAIQVEHWARQVESWNARHPTESAGRERLAAFGETAKEYVQNLEQRLSGGGTR